MPRAFLNAWLHKQPAVVPTEYSPIPSGTRKAKLIQVNLEDEDHPKMEGYLPPDWFLNTSTVSLTDGTTTYGPFTISAVGDLFTIDIDSALPIGNYTVLDTPVTDTNSNDRPIIMNIVTNLPIDGGGSVPDVPALPAGQAFLVDDLGNYLIDDDGDFLTADE